MGWSETCEYAGGRMECSYGGGSASDIAASSAGEGRRISSWRLSRVPLRLVLRERRGVEGRDGGDAPKKSSIASVVSSTEARFARGVWVRAGVGCASCASRSMSCAGVVGRSNRPKRVVREVEEDATGEDIVVEIVDAGWVSSNGGGWRGLEVLDGKGDEGTR